MKNSPHRIKHEQRKAIREAQKEVYQENEEVKKEEKKNFVTSPKTNKVVQNKVKSKKTSHMTSPDDVTWETEPESLHKEGRYWMKIIQKKTLDSAKRIQKKFKLFRKKK